MALTPQQKMRIPTRPPEWDLSHLVSEMKGVDSPEARLDVCNALLEKTHQRISTLHDRTRGMQTSIAKQEIPSSEELLETLQECRAMNIQLTRMLGYLHQEERAHFYRHDIQETIRHARENARALGQAVATSFRHLRLPEATYQKLAEACPELRPYSPALQPAPVKTNAQAISAGETPQTKDAREAELVPLYDSIVSDPELMNDPEKLGKLLAFIANTRTFQGWRAARKEDCTPDGLAARRTNLPDHFLSELTHALPEIVDGDVHAEAVKEALPNIPEFTQGVPEFAPNYNWRDAAEVVINAFAEFHPELGDLAYEAFTNGWFHAAPSEYKRPGASTATPATQRTIAESHPYIAMHFDSTIESLFTMVHELGHAMADHLSGVKYEQPLQDMGLHETFALFSERLLLRHLIAHAASPVEQAALHLRGFDQSIKVLTQGGKINAELALFEATAEDPTPELTPESTIHTIRQAMLPVANVAPENVDDFRLAQHIIQNRQMWRHEPFYNAMYTLAETAGMQLHDRHAHLPDDEREAFAEQWMEVLRDSPKLHYGDALAHMGIDISTPADMIKTAKQQMTNHLIEATRCRIKAEAQSNPHEGRVSSGFER